MGYRCNDLALVGKVLDGDTLPCSFYNFKAVWGSPLQDQQVPAGTDTVPELCDRVVDDGCARELGEGVCCDHHVRVWCLYPIEVPVSHE